MASDLPLFTDEALARNSDPDTSHSAARKVDVAKLEGRVLAILRIHASTADELAFFLNLPLNTVSPRTRPLVNKGLIEDSGERRATRTGRKAIVWRTIHAKT